MGIAKARMLEPLKYISVPMNKRALVIGGGMAGISSALALADQGFVPSAGKIGPFGRQRPPAP